AALQERVLKKLSEGLNPGGFLILGHNESILRKSASNQLESFYPVESIYRRSKSKVLTNPN
ncbi:MAG TPA: CheR family methyltransferase, partial [Bacteroidia bacterium]|nr:CheR family methyltransferase [Bacteroidia bacterium]